LFQQPVVDPFQEAKDMKDLTDFRRAWTVSRNAIAAKVEQAMQPLQEWLEARWIKTKDLLKVMNLVNQVTRKKDKLN